MRFVKRLRFRCVGTAGAGWLRGIGLGMTAAWCAAGGALADDGAAPPPARPNIVFAFADDWGRHASAYGTPAIRTPSFDRLAAEGVLFNHAFVAAPSCTPSRNAILTGQWPWRLRQGASLWSSFPDVPVFTDALSAAGYHVGHFRKAWGPGRLEFGERRTNPAGAGFPSVDAFFAAREEGKPFFLWFGASDPHRPYDRGSGRENGIDPARVEVPAFLPDVPVVREDIADYFFEVQRFDREVGELMERLDAMGELENTVLVMSGDHGMPFPRCKSNCYDSGLRVPLAVRWPARWTGGRTVDDFVGLADLAPTFLEIAGLEPGEGMTGRSIVPLLDSGKDGWVEPGRDHLIAGKERHVPSQPGGKPLGYPTRVLRTREFLYIRNLAPDRWPAGVLDPKESYVTRPFADCDAGPTMGWIIDQRESPAGRRFFDLAFGKRPAEELYHVPSDPDQIRNRADDPALAEVKAELAQRLDRLLEESGDPRQRGEGDAFDAYPYYGSGRQNPRWEEYQRPRGGE